MTYIRCQRLKIDTGRQSRHLAAGSSFIFGPNFFRFISGKTCILVTGTVKISSVQSGMVFHFLTRLSLGGQRGQKSFLALYQAILKKAGLRGAAYDFFRPKAKIGSIIGLTSRLWSWRIFLLKFEMAVRKWPPAEGKHGTSMRLFPHFWGIDQKSA